MSLNIENEADALRLKDMLETVTRSPNRVRDSLLHFALLCERSGQDRSALLLRAAAGPGESSISWCDTTAAPHKAAGPVGDE